MKATIYACQFAIGSYIVYRTSVTMASQKSYCKASETMSRDRLDLAVRQIEFAREYTLGMIKDIEDDLWFRQCADCPTHIAWQIGHLAMAQYALTMIRIRGKEPEDEQLLSKNFFRSFQKGTSPIFDASEYPTPEEIRATLNRVHNVSLSELSRYDDKELDVKLPEPHAVFDTKLGSVFFCSAHEMMHAGQIGLLRRMMGKAPIR